MPIPSFGKACQNLGMSDIMFEGLVRSGRAIMPLPSGMHRPLDP